MRCESDSVFPTSGRFRHRCPFPALIEEWPEFADEIVLDLRYSKHESDIDPPVRTPKRSTSTQKDAWSETSEEEEDEIFTPRGQPGEDSVTSCDASEKGGLLQGLLDYAEYEHVERDPEGAMKRRATRIDISEDEIPVKHEDPCVVDHGQAPKSVLMEIDVQRKLCNVCLKRFSRTDALKRHHKSVHQRLRPFKCIDCGLRYQRKYLLDPHRGFRRAVHARARVARSLEQGERGTHKLFGARKKIRTKEA